MGDTAIRFRKMNGIGNQILVVDLRQGRARMDAAVATALAAEERTHFDQLMVMLQPERSGTAARLAIFNADGSQSAACGNGMRCVAATVMAETGEDQRDAWSSVSHAEP